MRTLIISDVHHHWDKAEKIIKYESPDSTVFLGDYFDDWGAKAHTIRGAYLIALREEQDFLEIALRYHSQDAVDYYKDRFGSTERFMTSDSDMSKFNSFEPSVMYSRSLGGLHMFGVDFQDAEWGNSLTYAKRNTGLQYTYLQTSLAFFF